MAQDKIRYRVVEKRDDLFEVWYKHPYPGEWTKYSYCTFTTLGDATDAIRTWQTLAERTNEAGKVVWESE